MKGSTLIAYIHEEGEEMVSRVDEMKPGVRGGRVRSGCRRRQFTRTRETVVE